MRFSVWSARRHLAVVEKRHEVVDLVQHLLEPELVDLVDDDEERLVVLGPVRYRILQGEELAQLQVFRIRRRHGVAP